MSFLSHKTGLRWTGAENAQVCDSKGRTLIDFTSGIFCTNIGHGNPVVTAVIKDYANRIHCYTYDSDIRDKYIERLCEWTGFEAAALFSSGTEATEAAWKMARIWTGVGKIEGRKDAFHGKTLGALLMAGKLGDAMTWGSKQGRPRAPHCGKIFEPYTPKTAKFRTQAFVDTIKERKVGRSTPYVIILDEIQSGFYRTGKMFGYEHFKDLSPDLVCIGKGMGNGFPLSGVLGPEKIIEDPRMELSSTHGGNPLACAVGLAVIDFMDKNLIAYHANLKGEMLHKRLSTFGIEKHGHGMVAGLIFEDVGEADRIVLRAEERGLLLVHTGAHTVKIGPPLTIQYKTLERGLEILKEVIDDIKTETRRSESDEH